MQSFSVNSASKISITIASGWGYLFEEGGRGYSISRDALTACFQYIDGSGEYTSFADEVLMTYKTPQMLLGALYEGEIE